MVENYDLHTLFGVIDKNKFVSECIHLVMDKDVKEIVSTCRVDKSTSNLKIGNCLQQERHDLLFEDSVNYYYPLSCL